MDEILKRLRDVCAQTCGESTDEWCETHRTCLECRTDLVDAIEKELDGWMELPRDADGVPIRPGDRMYRIPYVKAMTVDGVEKTQDGWRVYFDTGRGLRAATAVDNVTHVAPPDTFERIIGDALTIPVHDKAAIAELVERCERLAGGRA